MVFVVIGVPPRCRFHWRIANNGKSTPDTLILGQAWLGCSQWAAAAISHSAKKFGAVGQRLPAICLCAHHFTERPSYRSHPVTDGVTHSAGAILTKMDGDSRGGAALSVKAVSGKPIKFVGTGEKMDNLEPFYPDRLAGRVLGMGDVLTLVEKAQGAIDERDASAMMKKMLANKFDLDDFLGQYKVLFLSPVCDVDYGLKGCAMKTASRND